ncbi:MAG: ATPase, T2SS/T4P/T4SS family [Candidatus Micrarchaeaceae archaeon]
MNSNEFYELELSVFTALEGKLSNITSESEVNSYIERVIKSIKPTSTREDMDNIIKDAKSFGAIDKYVNNDDIEDIMVNNTSNVFVYKSDAGMVKVQEKVNSKMELTLMVAKMKMYNTNSTANRNIFDVHLPNGSRANIVDTPMGPDITIRNFKNRALSVIDLVNFGEFSWNMAARLWLYADGMNIRPANMLLGGMPAAGKTTLLNSLFSFFRPESRVAVIEDTYELNTFTQENCVRLETSIDLSMEDLVRNTLRMRPDIIIIGEVRGAEAKDMMTAMNIGKVCISTIHASTTRDIVTRLEHSPMNIDKDIIPLIDALVVMSRVKEGNKYRRKITQVSEISGFETQVLLSDLYTYDYKTHKSSDILPSITYRDALSKLTGFSPTEIINEEKRRAKVLEKLNQIGVRNLAEINEFCKEYYDNQGRALAKIGLQSLGTLE